MKNKEIAVFVRERILNHSFEIENDKRTIEYNFKMPDNAEAITGVMGFIHEGIKTAFSAGIIYLSNEQVIGSFASFSIVGTANNIDVSNVSGSPKLSETAKHFTDIHIPVKGGDNIRLVWNSDFFGDATIFKTLLSVSIRYKEREPQITIIE